MHQLPQPNRLLCIEAGRDESLVVLLLQECWETSRLQISECDALNRGMLEQIVGTGRALQSGTEHQHAHRVNTSDWSAGELRGLG